MSETPAAPEQASAAAAPTRKASPMVLGGVIAIAALAGAGGGVVLAPRLAPPSAVATADGEAHAGSGAAEGSEGERKGHGNGDSKVVRLDNLIVNPAGSEGTRFLMTTVAFEVETDAAEAALKANEIAVRDLVIGELEGQTLAMLTRPFARDSLKRQIAAAVGGVIGRKARVRVYLPQFVIQ